MSQINSPRFIFEITEEQQFRALRIFSEHGMRRQIMSRLLDEVMDMVEEHGYLFLAVLLDKSTSSSEIRKMIPSMKKVEGMVKR